MLLYKMVVRNLNILAARKLRLVGNRALGCLIVEGKSSALAKLSGQWEPGEIRQASMMRAMQLKGLIGSER